MWVNFAHRDKKMKIFLNFAFFQKCQNPNKIPNLCIFGNLGLSSAGKFCTCATKNDFFYFIFFCKVSKSLKKHRIYVILGYPVWVNFACVQQKMKFFF